MNSSFKKLILMNSLYGLLWGVIFIWAKYMDVISEAPKGGIFRFDFQSLVGCILLSGIYLFPLFKIVIPYLQILQTKKTGLKLFNGDDIPIYFIYKKTPAKPVFFYSSFNLPR